MIEEYAPIAQICRIVNEKHQPDAKKPGPREVIASRHAWRKRSIFNGACFVFEKAVGAVRHKLGGGS